MIVTTSSAAVIRAANQFRCFSEQRGLVLESCGFSLSEAKSREAKKTLRFLTRSGSDRLAPSRMAPCSWSDRGEGCDHKCASGQTPEHPWVPASVVAEI